MTTFARKSLPAISPIFEGWKTRTQNELLSVNGSSSKPCRRRPPYVRLTQFAPVFSFNSTLCFFAADFMRFQALSRSTLVTPCTCLKRAIALRT